MLTNQTKKVQDLVQALMSPKQVEKFIKILQDDIETISKDLTPKLAALKELETDYNNMKLNVDSLKNELEENQRSLENVVRQRDKKTRGEDVHVMRPTSHLNAEKKKKVTKETGVAWMHEFRIILESEQKMMTARQLTQAYWKRYPTRKNDKFYYKGATNAQTNVNRSAEQTKERLIEGRQPAGRSGSLIDYVHGNDKYFGLVEWFDDNFIPLPKYMSQFVYNNGVVPHAKHHA